MDKATLNRDPYREMHRVLEQLREGRIEAALQWVHNHKQALDAHGHAFEFKLRQVQFIRLLRDEGQIAALEYAKRFLSPLVQPAQARQLHRLMGTLLYPLQSLADTPYADLQRLADMEEVTQDFIRNCCGIMGQAYESPLLVSVAAGSAALPQLLKFASLMRPSQKTWQDLRTCEQLPLEVDIGREFNFHSIFACPVSKDMSTSENPPVMLPCGHVLCKSSVFSIAKGATVTFKCPYCPIDTTPSNCRNLVFPDVE